MDWNREKNGPIFFSSEAVLIEKNRQIFRYGLPSVLKPVDSVLLVGIKNEIAISWKNVRIFSEYMLQL